MGSLLRTAACYRGLEVLQQFGDLHGELVVEHVREDVLHAAVLKQVLREKDSSVRRGGGVGGGTQAAADADTSFILDITFDPLS